MGSWVTGEYHFSLETMSYYTSQADLKFGILLPHQPSGLFDHRSAPGVQSQRVAAITGADTLRDDHSHARLTQDIIHTTSPDFSEGKLNSIVR